MNDHAINDSDPLRSKVIDLIWAIQSDSPPRDGAAQLEGLLKENLALRREFIEYMGLIAEMRLGAEPELIANTLSSVLADSAADIPATGQPEYSKYSPRKTSPILGFLGNFAELGGDMAGASFFQWAVLGLLGSGFVAVIVFVTMSSVARFNRANLHEVAESPPPAIAPKDTTTDIVAPVSKPPQCAARLTRVSDVHWLDRDEAARPGTDLFQGHRVRLDSGRAEFYFEGGAIVLLRGPAQLEFLSRKSARLAYGSVTVTIEDPLSAGFELHTPGMKYTDLGTEFGVNVERDGKQEMDVFRGHVAAEVEPIASARRGDGTSQTSNSISPIAPTAAVGHPSAVPTTDNRPPATVVPAAPLILTANQALKLTPGHPIEQIVANEHRFIRDISGRAPIPIFSSGFGLGRGDADSHWTITAVSSDPTFVPRPATVCNRNYGYIADSPKTAQWISLTKVLQGMPEGCRVTFRTNFELTGVDPATAQIDGLSIADNWVVEVRLNGRPVAIPHVDKTAVLPKVPLQIASGFVPGENKLELVIENGPDTMAKPGHNVMALYFQCSGSAKVKLDTATGAP